MKVLSLFDGISGARQALKNIGADGVAYYSSEIDPYAVKVSEKNFPDIIRLGDVKLVKGMDDLDLLIGGSPCQDLSVAKKDRKGLDGERSGLFWEYARILKESNPKYFVLENVASMRRGDRDIITKELGVEPILINSALVTAQSRKRLYWTNIPNIVQPEDRGIVLGDILENSDDYTDRLKKYCIDASYYKGANFETYINKGKRQLVYLGRVGEKDWAKDGKELSRNAPQGQRVYSPEGKSACLSAHGGGQGAKTGLYYMGVAARTRTKGKEIEVRKDEEANCLASVMTDSMVKLFDIPKELLNDNERQRRVYSTEGKTPTVLARTDSTKIMIDDCVRKLTPIECERLQGYPDNYTEGVSNTRRYIALGNSFTVTVIEHILKGIL